MRDYARFSARFWTGETGRKMRGKPNLQVVAAYLFTAPNANMIGLYYLPLPIVAHETGVSAPEVAMAMKRLRELEVAFYDAHSEVVYIPAMASYQIGETIPSSNRNLRKGVEAQLKQFRGHPFGRDFLIRYGAPYGLGSPLEAPSKPAIDVTRVASEGDEVGDLFTDRPLRDQDQDQEPAQEQEQAKAPGAPACLPARSEKDAKIWASHEWLRRYGLAWCQRYQQLAYGQTGDTIATGKLHDLLSALSEQDRLAAQGISEGMFAEFLGGADQNAIQRRHPWSFFVHAFGGLRVPKVALVKPAAAPPESFAERDARLKREQRERDRADSRRQQAATDAKAAEYREWAEAK